MRVTAQPAPRLRAQIAEGLHWLWRHRELRAICSDGAIAFALLAVVGATAMLWNVLSAAFRQAVVPGRLMGRVNSVYRGATWGVVPLGAALGGFTADHLGLRAPLLLSAGVLIMASAAALPRLRNARLAAARAAGG